MTVVDTVDRRKICLQTPIHIIETKLKQETHEKT